MIQSVSQVLKISHIEEHEAIWQWGHPEHTELPKTIEVLIWNIWKESGGLEFFADYQRLTENLDLILLQEVLLNIKAFSHLVPKGKIAHHAATYRRKDGLRDGVMTISSADLRSSAVRVLCLAPEPLLRTTKATLITWYKLEGHHRLLCAVNMHSTLFRSPKSATKELERVLFYISHHQGPILFAGDFNSFSKNYLLVADKTLGDIGLKRIKITGDPRPAIWLLDHVYVRDLECTKIAIETNIRSSDHFPIRATLVARNQD